MVEMRSKRDRPLVYIFQAAFETAVRPLPLCDCNVRPGELTAATVLCKTKHACSHERNHTQMHHNPTHRDLQTESE